MSRPLLGLCMIVKDEAASIRATLESVADAVDHVTIVDTGSTDQTLDVLHDLAAARLGWRIVLGDIVPYAPLLPRRVINFAATRNACLDEHMRRSDRATFTLMLSGDEEVSNPRALRDYLAGVEDASDGAYRVQMRRDESRWLFPRVLRTDALWRYKNPIHESPVSPTGETGGPTIPGVEVVYKVGDQARLHRRMREVDLPILEQMAAGEPQTHEEHAVRAHALLQLGQTHENLALEHPEAPGSARTSHSMAAMGYYWRRSELEGDPDDANYALFKFYSVADVLGIYSHAELVERLKVLVNIDPKRPETRYMLAAHSAAMKPGLGLPLALEAARVAHEARKDAGDRHMPVDGRCEWLSLRVAAACAKMLGLGPRARALAGEGIVAGGPREAFVEFLS